MEKVAKNPIIEEIHQEFSSEQSKLLKRITHFQSEVNDDERRDLALKLKEKGFENSISVNKFNSANISKAQQLIAAIENYKVVYPTKKFITEDALYEICAKYGLIITTPDRYTGFIPYEKQKEIVEFKLDPITAKKHQFHLDINKENKEFLSNIIDNTSSAIDDFTNEQGDHLSHSLHVDSVLFGKYGEFLRKYKSEVANFLYNEKHYNFFDSRSKEPMVRLPHMRINNFRFPEEITKEYDKRSFESSYVMVASKNLIDEAGMRINNKFELVPFIPEEAFDELREDIKKEEEKENERRFFVQDDPIFLAKVDHGYIIVSAWGEEAEDPLVTNHNFN